VSEHQLLLFLLELSVLFVAARVGAEVAARLRVPLHVGELVMGMALGPSFLGWLWPEARAALFPDGAAQRSLLELVSWIGIILLVLLGGLEARLGILRRAGAAVVGAWVGGFVLPFAGGLGLGLVLPDRLMPPGVDRPVFALFLATAMSISAIPVIARILMDLDLYRTRLGMVILSSALADDTIGWVMLSVVAGLATGGLRLGAVLGTILLTVGFVAVAFTAGRPLVLRAMRFSRRTLRAPFAPLSMMLLLVLGAGAITQAIGVHLVLGAFVAAILLGRGPVDRQAHGAIRQVAMAFFVPFFFAYTGARVDLTSLHGSGWAFAGMAILVACSGKVLGGGLGARVGGLPRWEALGVGFGLNARGAMELVIAAIGLSIGVLNEASYAIVVLIAVFTTVIASPLLQLCAERAGRDAGAEEARLPAPASVAG
jgi:Kef-type K+ transport system membrane component KefB